MNHSIVVKGARVNNLKNIDVEIPREQFVVITGLSGSGKSSLAFDTLYAEGQRRYVESLSAYARQFLGRMNKPECDYIKGLPPAIAIEQKVKTNNPRSTVGTSTEIYEYLRLLFARVDIPTLGERRRGASPQRRRHSSAPPCAGRPARASPCSPPCVLLHERTFKEQIEVLLQQGLFALGSRRRHGAHGRGHRKPRRCGATRSGLGRRPTLPPPRPLGRRRFERRR